MTASDQSGQSDAFVPQTVPLYAADPNQVGPDHPQLRQLLEIVPDGHGGAIGNGIDYNVTYEYLSQACQVTYKVAENVQTQLANLKKYVQKIEAVYGGVAADAFQILMAEYDNYASMMHNALVDIGDGLGKTFDNYYNTEAQNINNIRELGGNIPTPPTGTNFN